MNSQDRKNHGASLPDIPVSKEAIPGKLRRASYEVRPVAELAVPASEESAFVRTLKGKNRTGKTIYGILTLGVSLLTGVNINPITQFLTTPLTKTNIPMIDHLSLFNVIIYIVIFFASFLIQRGLVKGLLKQIFKEIEEIASEVKAARSATSPGGKKVTEQERELIVQRVETLVMTLYKRLLRDRIARLFGLKVQKKEPEQ